MTPAPRRGRRPRATGVAGASAPVTPAGRGIRVEDHTWLDAATLRCGITSAFAARLGRGPVDLTLPSPGLLHRTSDALAHVTGEAGETLRVWSPLTAAVAEVNPALADDPGLLLRDPEALGWLARLAPTAWAQEAGGLEWGPRGVVAYRAALAATDPWAELRSTAVHVRSAQEVLAELRRRRAAPRFADADAVHAELVAPLAAALAAAPEAAASLARLRVRLAFVLTEPDTAFALDARGLRARVDPEPGAADVTLSLDADAAASLLSGRLDVARALRSGELRSSVGAARTLAIASVLTGLPRVISSPAPTTSMRT